MRSALRDIRHLQTIPELADWDRGWADKSARGLRIAEARKARMGTARQRAREALPSELRPYLLSRQHDAWIQSFRREDDRFTITVYDEDLAVLAAHAYDVDWSEVAIPFQVVFTDVTYVGWRHVDDQDRLTFATAPTVPVEWLGDTFVDRNDAGVRWALQFHISGRRRRDGTHVLFVEAGGMTVVENARELWRGRFGEEALGLFDRYATIRTDQLLANSPEGAARIQNLLHGAPNV